jgi:hypothetical protein
MGNCFNAEATPQAPQIPPPNMAEAREEPLIQKGPAPLEKLERRLSVSHIDICKCGKKGREFFIMTKSVIEREKRHFYCNKCGETWADNTKLNPITTELIADALN